MINHLNNIYQRIKNETIIKILIIFLIVNAGIFIIGTYYWESSLNLHLLESTLYQRRHLPVSRIDVNTSMDLRMYDLPLNASMKMFESRRMFNQPKITHENFRVWTVEVLKPFQKPNTKTPQSCAIINSYNIVQQSTISTVLSLLDSPTITKVILLTRDRDPYSQNLLGRINRQRYRIDNEQATIDSQYNFITKYTTQYEKVIYLQSRFKVYTYMVQNIEKVIKSNRNYSLIYSSMCRVNGEIKKLPSLTSTSLQTMSIESVSLYLFVFNTSLLTYITPLNFAYYAKYSFEQILIWPILALLQQTTEIYASDQVLHSYNFTSISIPQFAVKSPSKQNNSICFVSYPTHPQNISFIQTQSYIDSLDKMYKQQMNISLVVYLPYRYGYSAQIVKVLAELQKLRKSGAFARIRLRIRANKTVSTLSAYESVYQYCPNQSLIVTSRQNVKFHYNFARQVLKSVTSKYHYIHTSFVIQNEGQLIFNQLPLYDKEYSARRSDLFEKYFRHFQIYKSDFLKTNLFWVLKNEELDFYQTESPLVNLMMEETRLQFEYINKTLVTVAKRIPTELEKMQIRNVKAYVEYSKLINNQLMPYKYNCLENPAYRRYAPDLMERNIHQIWITDQPIPKIRMDLHETIKQKNPNFNVTLWKAADITKENFPTTYQIVQRTFEHHKDSERSFFTLAADLLRYELIYKYGGIYVDFKMEGKKPLDKFLKYQIFYLDCDIQYIRFGNPQAIGIGVMGSMQNSYHMKKLLYQIIFEQNIKFSLQVPKESGGWNGRKSFTDEELFTLLGLGYQLLFPLPYDKIVNDCGGIDKQFDSDQTVYEVFDVDSRKVIKIGLPCKQYPESYLISYTPLAKTWLSSKNAQLQALNQKLSIPQKTLNQPALTKN